MWRRISFAVLMILVLACTLPATSSATKGSASLPKTTDPHGIEDGPTPVTLFVDAILDAPDLGVTPQYCPSTNGLCRACEAHAIATHCSNTRCSYLVYAYVGADGVIHCEWMPYAALKNFQ